jgi:hypothetical protein
MSEPEFAMLLELAAVVLTAVVATGAICTAVVIWRDEKKWKGDEE